MTAAPLIAYLLMQLPVGVVLGKYLRGNPSTESAFAEFLSLQRRIRGQ